MATIKKKDGVVPRPGTNGHKLKQLLLNHRITDVRFESDMLVLYLEGVKEPISIYSDYEDPYTFEHGNMLKILGGGLHVFVVDRPGCEPPHTEHSLSTARKPLPPYTAEELS